MVCLVALGGRPEGQTSPEMLDNLQEETPKGAGAGRRHVLKEEPAVNGVQSSRWPVTGGVPRAQYWALFSLT